MTIVRAEIVGDEEDEVESGVSKATRLAVFAISWDGIRVILSV